MTRLAVEGRKRIGVIVTFPPTQAVTRQLLTDAAAGNPIEIVDRLIPAAVEAILAGDQATYDRLLTFATDDQPHNVDAIVLAEAADGSPRWTAEGTDRTSFLFQS